MAEHRKWFLEDHYLNLMDLVIGVPQGSIHRSILLFYMY